MSEKIFQMLDLFYANKHLYEKIKKKKKSLRAGEKSPAFLSAPRTIGPRRNFHYITSRIFCQVKFAKKLHKFLS